MTDDLTADTVVIENGLHPAHDVNDPVQKRANLDWFAALHAVYKDGDINITDFCAYMRTSSGWRRMENDEFFEEAKKGQNLFVDGRAMGDGWVPPRNLFRSLTAATF